MAEDLIDHESWEALKMMTEPDFLASLIDVFLSDSPEIIRQMQSGVAAGDIELVRRSAHTLKSNSASFGANRLAGAARELEMIAKNGTLEGATPKLEAVEREFIQLSPVILELKNGRQ